MIFYSLQENRLVEDPNMHIARVNTIHNVGINEFADYLCARGSTLTKTDVLGLLQMMEETIESLVAQSYSVSLPFATFNSSIKGNFIGITDQYEPSRHDLRPNVRAGARLKHFFTHGVQAEKEVLEGIHPIVIKFEDKGSGTFNSAVTANGIGRLYGKSMAIDESDTEQGIFLVNQNDRSRIKIEKIADVRPSFLAFVLPEEIPAGVYRFAVKTRHGQELREGVLRKDLIVV